MAASKKHTLEYSNSNSQPSSKKSRKAPVLPPISWAADDSFLVWKLLGELEKTENYKVLFGKKTQHENTSGERKTTVYRRVGKALLPHLYDQEPTTVGDRVKAKVEGLIGTYRCQAKRLRVTGGGLGDEESQDTQNTDQYMDFYIGAGGPDDSTTSLALNLWEQIEDGFPFFPRLHAILAARPNVIPIAITTAVGPDGRKTVFYQPPTNFGADSNKQQTTDVEVDNPLNPVQQHQYSNLLAALAAAGRPPSDTSSDSHVTPQMPSRSYARSPSPPISRSFVISRSPSPDMIKENISPLMTTRRATKKASLASQLLERARASIKKIPPKPTLEETLIQVQRENLRHQQHRANEELLLKKRTLLMDEYKAGLWTLEEYRQNVADLTKQPEKLTPVASTSQIVRSPSHTQSIDWDIEQDDDTLPDISD